MMEEINFVEDKGNNAKYQAKCFHCKDKEEIKTEHGTPIKLGFKFVGVDKDKALLKECKEMLKDAEGKYYNTSVVKRALINGCPNCGKTIIINCKDYVDCYTTHKKKVEQKESSESTKNVEETK